MEKILLTIIASFLLLTYLPLNRRTSKFCLKSKLDEFIPLLSLTVWPYIIFIPYIFTAPIILWNSSLYIGYISAVVIAASIGNLIWYIFPNGVQRPSILTPQSLSERILAKIYKHDKDTNGFPSSHVFYTIVTTYYLALAFPTISIPLWALGIAISISTVTTKQHYAIDIIGGVITAIIAVIGSSFATTLMY